MKVIDVCYKDLLVDCQRILGKKFSGNVNDTVL